MKHASIYARDLLFLFIGFPVWGLLLFYSIIRTLYRDKKPVFYTQTRIGKDGKPFEIYKIRTMLVDSNLADDLRITSNGHFLRDWSLDELPQIWNVLKGEMSLIGPRPLIWAYKNELPEHISEHRHSIKPGLTGWAQVNGRNEIGWEEKLALDAWYVDNRSFWLDINILFKTLPIWALRKGIYTSDGKMMPDLQLKSTKTPTQNVDAIILK
ncbi:sugar transferase [bacterium]|nr:MAG: sugar transferase [bacterium]